MMPVGFCVFLVAVIGVLADMLLFEVKGHRGAIAQMAKFGAYACRVVPYLCLFVALPSLLLAVMVAITPVVSAAMLASQRNAGCGQVTMAMVMLCAFLAGSLVVRARG